VRCAICGKACFPKDGSTEDYTFQDNFEFVHTSCRNLTLWKSGERVVTEFMYVGTVREARTLFIKHMVAEWVLVEFDDGFVGNYAASNLRKAPEQSQ